MRKIIAYPLVWILFWIGDWISRTILFEKYGNLYTIYNNCMIWSSNIQDWGKLKNPWKKTY